MNTIRELNDDEILAVSGGGLLGDVVNIGENSFDFLNNTTSDLGKFVEIGTASTINEAAALADKVGAAAFGIYGDVVYAVLPQK